MIYISIILKSANVSREMQIKTTIRYHFLMELKVPSTNTSINKMWYIHTREYYSDIKRNEVLILATAWMNLKTPFKWKEPGTKGPMPDDLCKMCRIGKSIETDSRLLVARGEWGMTASRLEFPSEGDVLKSFVVNRLKATDLYASNRWTAWCVNHSLIKALKQKEGMGLGGVAHACNPSTLAGQGEQMTWGQESKTSLANMAKPLFY